MRQLIRATYQVTADAPFDVGKRAEAVALGQTTDTWTPLNGADRERLQLHRGVVLEAREATPGRDGKGYSATFTIGFSPGNTQGDIATLLVMVFGKVSLDGKIRLTHLGLPEVFLQGLPGPRFGIPGLRDLLHAPERPLVMSIFKPCLGLTPGELGEMYFQQALGGSQIIKDDEILPDLDICPTEARLEACLKAAELADRETGLKSLYAVNLTGPVTDLVSRAEEMVSRGANCLLLNVLAYGYPVLEALARDTHVSVPILAHPALAGAIGSAPEHGMSYRIILGTLMRAAGADIVLFPSSFGTIALPQSETDSIRDALTEPMGRMKRVFPGPSGGIHPGLVPQILRDYGNEVVVNAGGGVHGHPHGARSGAKAFQQAIELTMHGLSLEQESTPELAQALGLWGR